MTPSPWYDYSYLPCQFCVGKNHCAQCGEEIRHALLGMDGVMDAEMDVPARRLRLLLEGVDASSTRPMRLGYFYSLQRYTPTYQTPGADRRGFDAGGDLMKKIYVNDGVLPSMV